MLFVVLKEICVSRMNFKYFSFSVWIEVNFKKNCKAFLEELIDSKQAQKSNQRRTLQISY